MKNSSLLLRLYSQMNVRVMLLALVAVVVLSISMSVAAQDSASLAGQKCPQSVVDSYTVIGPDGNVYPTWHPAVDPTYGCWFDDEHGSDPHKFVGFAAVGMPPFGYVSKTAGLSEPLEGFKVYITNNDLNGHAWMIVLHQGTRGPKRAFTQYHSLEWYITTLDGKLLVAIRTMADFGYASPNCSGPGNQTPAQFVAIPGTGSGYAFSGYQLQRRFVPTVECASTRPYENWNGLVNVANVFKALPTFDIDNASTVINPSNPNDVRYMCEFRSPGENCASFYGTQWSGNKRGIIHPQQQVNNPGPQEFYTDPYGKSVTAGTPGSIKQFVTNQGWNQTPCNCVNDIFRLPRNSGGLYLSPDPGAGNDSFPFGPGATGSQPPPSTPVPTVQPPSTPVPPLPTDPSLIVYVNPANANPGDNVEVDIGVANLNGLYGLQTQCTVDPNVLKGTTHSDGTIFTTGTSFFVDNGFKAGNWTVAASLLQPHPAFSGNGLAYKLNYTVQSAGSSPVTCTALAVNINGKELPVKIINGSFSGGAPAQPTAVPTQPPQPTVVVPTDIPTQPPQPTVVVPTNVPPTVEPPPTQLSTISGVMTYQNHPDNAGITVQLVTTTGDVLATVTTGADGRYSFTDVPVGSYGVTAIAPQHLRIGKVVDVTADGQSPDLGSLMLPAGDTDDSGGIDILDAGLVGANFDGAVPPSPANADLNLDGVIDIRDLALVGSNFGLTGPVVIK